MATKNIWLKSTQTFDDGGGSDNVQYKNLNLNQNHESISIKAVTSKSDKNKKRKVHDFTGNEDHNWHSRNDMTSRHKSLSTKSCLNLYNSQEDDDFKKEVKKNSNSSKNSSTLSLHIAAYENSIECGNFDNGKNLSKDTKQTSFSKAWKGGGPLIENTVEFPRQQKEEPSEPEVMQFKASQKLLNPNEIKSLTKQNDDIATDALTMNVKSKAMSNQEDEENRRIFEHFIVAGLSENPEELTPLEHECGNKPNEVLAPITDIVVIFPGYGEKVPAGFTCIETTPSGYPADLNHGSIRTHSAFLCYKRGYHKPPLVDIGVMDEGKKERLMEDSTVIQYTPDGRLANVSNTSSPLYFTYRRCKVTGPPHQLVITNIVVVITSKSEVPPHTFYKIDKNLNKAVVGSDVYVCYKKAQSCCRRIAYKPAVLDCFPKTDSENVLAQNVPMFCLPMGAVIESWSAKSGAPEQLFSTCVLTDAVGTKYYGASLTFYEKYTKELTPHQKEMLSFDTDSKSEGDEASDSSTSSPPKEDSSPEQLFFMNKSICIVSRHPFFECFRRFLYYVYLVSAQPSNQKIPIERYISHLMYEVPFPTPLRPRVLVQLGDEMIPFENHDDSQVPLSGAQFTEVLKCLGADTFIYAMSLALLEQKILIHSLRPWLLTVVSETICALMFPFYWQCPYIPQCPLALAGVLHAPLPFIAGVDSRYFDLYEDPPGDVTCLDLDTATVRHSINKKLIKQATLPKRSLKHLKASLEKVLENLRFDDRNSEKQRRQKSSDASDEQQQLRKASYEMTIREAFLRFMCSLMVGYSSFLKPIKSCPRGKNTTDISARFDLDGFLRTRDRASTEFYQKFSETQSFNRFIEERSFISDKVVYNAFFDDCIRKFLTKGTPMNLLDRDAYSVNHTIVVQPPFMLDTKHAEVEYNYKGFPNHFDHELFELQEIKDVADSKVAELVQGSPYPSKLRYSAIRTKQEIRTSIEVANKWTQNYPILWPRIVLFYAYSLWFLQLPSLLHVAKNKLKILRLAMTVLSRLNRSLVPLLDQIPFRLLMQLCGEYGYPHFAAEVLREMQRLNVEPNAITYAIYHKAVMEGERPSEARLNAIEAWKRLRLRLEGCVRFAAVRRDPNFILHSNNVQNLPPQNLDPTFSIENMSTLSVDDSAINPSVPSTPEPDTGSRSSKDTKDDEEKALEEQPYVITTYPLGPRKESKDSTQNVQSNVDPLLGVGESETTDEGISKASSLTMSPSREQFLREHSASPFAKDIASNQKIPIERYISHLMYEVPFPTPLRPRVLVQLGDEMISFESHDDSQVPLSGAVSEVSSSSPTVAEVEKKIKAVDIKENQKHSEGVKPKFEAEGLPNQQVATSSEGSSNKVFFVVVDFTDRKGSHGKQSFQFESEDIVKTLIDKICKAKSLDHVFLQIYYKKVQIFDPNLKLFNFLNNGDIVEAVHSSIEAWETLVEDYEFAMAARGNPKSKIKAANKVALDSVKLDNANFFLFYRKFAIKWKDMKTNERFMRMVDTSRTTMEACAKQYFEKLFPGCILKFEDKNKGSRSGVVIQLFKANESSPSIYFMKTYHLAGTSSTSSSARHLPDFRELFAYRLLNHMRIGPTVHFPYYKDSTQIYFIVTEAVKGFTELGELVDVFKIKEDNGEEMVGTAEQKLIYELTVEAHLLSLIFGLNDFNLGNFGPDEDKKLSVVDFEIGSESVISGHKIVDKFKDNLNNCYHVQAILDDMNSDEKYDIGKLALNRWSSLESASVSLIGKEKEELRKQGLKFKNDTRGVEEYFENIKKNFHKMKTFFANV